MPADLRERKKRRTHEAIQDAAFELFAQRGYRNTSIAAIAERADVAPRTVTTHFPAKDDLLFDGEPFTEAGLAAALSRRHDGESALDALRDWMARTMVQLETSGTAPRFWRHRAMRARIIDTEPELRARARASYLSTERVLADAIGADLNTGGSSLAPRLAALSAIIGLRENLETDEGRALPLPAETDDLLALVDHVIAFVRAGLIAISE